MILNSTRKDGSPKRVGLMRVMVIEALVSAPRHEQSRAWAQDISLSAARPGDHRANHVWTSYMTYIPMAHGFLYLVAIIDWAGRAVPAWRLSKNIARGSCVEALDDALAQHGKPRILIRIRARCSAAPRSPARLKPLASRSRWTGEKAFHGRHFHRTPLAVDQV